MGGPGLGAGNSQHTGEVANRENERLFPGLVCRRATVGIDDVVGDHLGLSAVDPAAERREQEAQPEPVIILRDSELQ
jgi:hypothetical protein